jgi:hypothetical protein
MPLPLLIPSGIKPKQTHFVIKRDDPTPTTRKGKKKKNLTKENSYPHSPAASTYRHQIFPQPQPHFTPESQKNEGKKKIANSRYHKSVLSPDSCTQTLSQIQAHHAKLCI